MSYVGYRPATVPFTADQIKPLSDQLYRRIDGGNVPLDRFPNALINGAFDHWQRGTSFVNGYTADRWRYDTAGGTGIGVTQQPFTVGDIASESTYFLRATYTATTGSGDYAIVLQPIEGARRLAGRRVVVRGMVRRSSGAGNMAIELEQGFGSGGSPNVTTAPKTVALSTLWTPFSTLIDVPSVVGKTIAGSDTLNLNFWLSSGSNFNARSNNLGLQTITVDFADLEVKEVLPGFGDQFPGFERVPREIELLRCQRYYEIFYAKIVGNAPAANYLFGNNFVFKAQKRVSPSIVVSPVGLLNATGPGVDVSDQNGCGLTITSTAAANNIQAATYVYVNAEF